jgi:hypothetical protein
MLSLSAPGPCTPAFPGMGPRSCSAAPVLTYLGNNRCACIRGAIGRPSRNCCGPLLRHQRALLVDHRRDLRELLAARVPTAAMLGATPRVGAERGLDPVGHFNAKQVHLRGGLSVAGIGCNRLLPRRHPREALFDRASQSREPGIDADLLLGRRLRFSHDDLSAAFLSGPRVEFCDQQSAVLSATRVAGDPLAHAPVAWHLRAADVSYKKRDAGA